MVTSIRCDPILQLGKKIVDELGLDQSNDTLGRWMAHHIAELIHSAESAGTEDRSEKLSRCASAISHLWRHRSELPNGRRPFEELEPILRTLEGLDPNDSTPRYFRAARTAATGEQDSETKQWLDLADDLDDSAKILTRYCLARAAQNALDRSKEWVALAQAAEMEDGVDLQVLSFLSDEAELSTSVAPDGKARREIQVRIERLEDFVKKAGALLDELQAQLKH